MSTSMPPPLQPGPHTRTASAGEAPSHIVLHGSLLDRAKAGDPEAITTMFRQFLCEDEQVIEVEYLGVRGLWIFGEHCWACVTDRRAGSLRVGKAGELIYQDALLEGINSGAIHQPSLMPLYYGVGLMIFLALGTFGGTLLLIPVVIFWYHKHAKCGIAFVVREGLNVWMFTNRKRLTIANRFYRRVMMVREKRVQTLSLQAQVIAR